MKDVFAFFHDAPGSPLDKAAHAIMAERGGRCIGAGTFLPTGERDVQFRFDDDTAAKDAVAALEKAGFKTKIKLVSAADH